MAQTFEIKTEGVGQLLRALNKVDKDLRTKIRIALVGVAGLVAVEAKQIAEQKGLRQSGDLISHIRPGFRSGYAYVADTARHGGYNYPGRIEFEKKYGDRSFLAPALERKKPEVYAGVEAVLDLIIREAGFE
jgi:hypothetical protein